eukprot:gene7690-8527_t
MRHQCNSTLPPVGLTYFSFIASIAFSLFAFVGNGTIAILVLVDPMKSLRTPANYFILNLAFSDMIVACITLPMSAWAHYVEITGLEPATVNVPLHVAFFVSVTACCLSVIALTVDRYVAIRWPIAYRRKFRLRRSAWVSISIWTIAGALSLAYFLLGYITYLMVFANGILLLTLMVLTALYIAVHRALSGHEKELVSNHSQSRRRISISLEHRQKKVTRVFLVVIIVFLLCTTPAEISIYIINFCSKCSCTTIHVLRDLQLMFVLSTSAMNPFISTLRLPTFHNSLRKITSQLLSRLPFFRDHPLDNSSEERSRSPSPYFAKYNGACATIQPCVTSRKLSPLPLASASAISPIRCSQTQML